MELSHLFSHLTGEINSRESDLSVFGAQNNVNYMAKFNTLVRDLLTYKYY